MPMLFDDNEVYFLKRAIPRDWKVIKAWLGNNEICVMISPDGKKFSSLAKVRDFLKKQKLSRRAGKENQMMWRSDEDEDTPLELSESAKYRRRHMAERNPLRNLRQRTLEKVFVKNAPEGEITHGSESARVRACLTELVDKLHGELVFTEFESRCFALAYIYREIDNKKLGEEPTASSSSYHYIQLES